MANRGMPSMLALLGLLAVAGYQNRDKIGAALNNMQSGSGGGGLGGLAGGLGNVLGGSPQGSGGLGGLLGGLTGGLAGGGLAGGLGDLLNSFQQAGHGETAQSWVTPGVPTQGLTPEQVEQAVGAENLAELSQRTGLSKEDLLKRLATSIPSAVDKLTPNGEMPTEDQLRERLGVPAPTPGQA